MYFPIVGKIITWQNLSMVASGMLTRNISTHTHTHTTHTHTHTHTHTETCLHKIHTGKLVFKHTHEMSA